MLKKKIKKILLNIFFQTYNLKTNQKRKYLIIAHSSLFKSLFRSVRSNVMFNNKCRSFEEYKCSLIIDEKLFVFNKK